VGLLVGDGRWLYFSDSGQNGYRIRKVAIDGGAPMLVREDNGIGCNLSGDALYYAKILTQATGAWDFELRVSPDLKMVHRRSSRGCRARVSRPVQ
jgi:hypothetical protein